MKYFRENCLLVIVAIVAMCGPVFAQQKVDKEEWKSLFNGKDIKDWIVKIHHHEVGEDPANTFRVEDGIIKVRYDKYDSFN